MIPIVNNNPDFKVAILPIDGRYEQKTVQLTTVYNKHQLKLATILQVRLTVAPN
jgi:hypothetical protein